MRKYLPVAIGIAAMLLAGPVLAKKRSPLEAATVKAASDCVAAAALNNPKITELYQQNKLKSVTDWIVLKSDACENQLTAMRLLHDRLYGAGTGRAFLLGDYLADLPRAVDERIRVEVENLIAGRDPPVVAHGGDEGTTLRVKKIDPNDVLMIREYPTSESRVIDTIPPNGHGIQYLDQASGDWLFVRYERSEGWVHSRYVEREKPPVRKGRRLDNDE